MTREEFEIWVNHRCTKEVINLFKSIIDNHKEYLSHTRPLTAEAVSYVQGRISGLEELTDTEDLFEGLAS